MARGALAVVARREGEPPSSWLTSISSTTVQASWPLGPLTVTVCPSSVTVTPEGIGDGLLADP